MQIETTKKVPRFKRVIKKTRKKTIKLYYTIALNYKRIGKLGQIDKTMTKSMGI